MKKLLFVLILVTLLASGVFCQSTNSSSPVDLVVLLDTSASMSGSYRETSNYLIGPFLREFLRIGDTFHLISFSGTPKLEISRRIEGVGDVETIIARLLLMYPLDPESNLSGALSFAESFASSLPSRSKKIVLISDGDAENTQSLVNTHSDRFRGLGADLQYIKVPVTGNGPSSGRGAPLAQTTAPSQSAQPAQTAQQGAQPSQTAQTTQPAQTAQQGAQPSQTAQTTQPAQTAQQSTQPSQATQPAQPAQTAPGTQTPQSTQPTQPAQTAQQGTQTPQSTQPTQPAQTAPGAQETQSVSQAGSSQASGPATTQGNGVSGTAQVQSPAQGTGQTQTAQASSLGLNIPLPLIIGLAILLLLILIAIFIFASRRLDKSPNRVISKAASPASPKTKAETRPETKPVTKSDRFTETRKTSQVLEYPPPRLKPLPKDKIYDENALPSDGSPVLLNLFVADQNTAIGKRNIHSVKPGYSYTIGGGKSDFLIFLVPVPPRIAEVRHDGRTCAFIPAKPQYFPDIGSQTIPNCIGKTFRVISDKKYELHIRLEKYEDPLHALNKMLRSIKVPGPIV